MAVNLMHSFERLTRAQRPMATKAGSLQDRLDNAFKEMLGLSADELPQDLQSSYQSIWDRLSGAQNHRPHMQLLPLSNVIVAQCAPERP
jgi:hypothetical protein